MELLVRRGGMTTEGLLDSIVRRRNGKPGVRERVEEILHRMCVVDGRGELVWREEGGM